MLGLWGSGFPRYSGQRSVDVGGEEINFSSWPIDAVAATANKCLHGVPGMAFLIARKETLQGLHEDPKRASASGLYLDLVKNWISQIQGAPAFTPAIPSLYALDQALVELASSGGWHARRDVYDARLTTISDCLSNRDIEPLLSPNDRSHTQMAFRIPAGIEYTDISAPLDQVGITIYSGQKQLENQIFRIAVMGDLTESDMVYIVVQLGKVCRI